MGVITLPWSMEQDRQNNVKANSIHVDDNFDTLLTATNKKLEQDGSVVPTADLPMGSHKITGLATPTASGDAATKGYVDSALLFKANLASPTFTGTPAAPTPAVSDNSTKIATTAFVVDVLEAIYPVGSLYIGTQNTCPMSAFFGTWELVATDRALWGGNGTNGNTTIAAGLPNITGSIIGSSTRGFASSATGCFTVGALKGTMQTNSPNERGNVYMDASRSSSIYGNSNTVQPPAYVVNVWRRTA